MRRAAIVLPLLLLAACSGSKSATGAPPGEDKALDQAAAALDANSPDINSVEIVDDDEGGNEDQSK
jgi:hypothetical protein